MVAPIDPADQVLLDRATELLEDPEADPQALLDHCALCHGRLQDTPPLHRIPLALAALQLIDAVRQRPLLPPPWFHTREEQCCRLAALAIHGLLHDGVPEAQAWLPQGVELLQRLHDLHRHQLVWVPNMLVELQDALDRQPDRLAVAVIGQAQAHPLLLELQILQPSIEPIACPNLQVATAADGDELQRLLAQVDVLITHQLPDDVLHGINGDITTLLIADLHFEGLHPWIGLLPEPVPAGSPLGDYHDFLAMAAAEADLDADAVLARPLTATVRDTLVREAERSLLAFAAQTRHCSVGLAELIAAHYRHTPLFHTINLPTQAGVRLLARALLQHLGVSAATTAPTSQHELLGALTLPIHPWVQQALDLDDWCINWGQRHGAPFSCREQLQASIAFYREHQDLIDTHTLHPKLQLARFLLQQSQRDPAVPLAPPTTAALINYFADVDMLAQQLQAGQFDHYDRIYIWDGPYGYRRPLLLLDSQIEPLAETPTGRLLLADPRVRYHYAEWVNERDKRISAYSAITEDIAVIHDTDEFFVLDRDRLNSFWQSPYTVACLTLQNIFVGGLRASDGTYDSDAIAQMPRRWGVFKRAAISPETHLDHGWLVGVDQKPIEPGSLFPHPLGHIVHLTGCRSAAGQATKMAFYISLALKDETAVVVHEHLHHHLSQGHLNRDQAQQILLRGDSGYSGVPHPRSGFRLNHRVIDPSLDDAVIERIIAAGHVVRPGTYDVLEGYPLQLWIDASPHDRPLQLQLPEAQPLRLQLWAWPAGAPPHQECDLQLNTTGLSLTLEARPEVLGRLLCLTLTPVQTGVPRLQRLSIEAP